MDDRNVNMSFRQEILIALGSNLGSPAGGRRETVSAALIALQDRGMRLRRTSRYFATPCFPAGAGPDYVNACAAMTYNGAPEDALGLMHEVESDFRRNRLVRWGSRSLDLDLIACGSSVRPDARTFMRWHDLSPTAQRADAPDRLILPHPRLQDRGFVLVPLADIASGWLHPVLGLTVRQMHDALPDAARAEIRAL